MAIILVMEDRESNVTMSRSIFNYGSDK